MSRLARQTQTRTRKHYASFGPPAIAWSLPLVDRARFTAPTALSDAALIVEAHNRAVSACRSQPPQGQPRSISPPDDQEVGPPDVQRHPRV